MQGYKRPYAYDNQGSIRKKARKGESEVYVQKIPYALVPRGINQTRGGAQYQTVARTRGVYGQGEMKYFDSELAAKAIVSVANWTGTECDPDTVPVANINTLFAPIQGAGISQRIGTKVKVYAIKIRGFINQTTTLDTTSLGNAQFIRLALVQDTQTNSTQAQGEQVFKAAVTTNVVNGACSWQNFDNFGRFKVLKDKTMMLQNPNITYDGDASYDVSSLGVPFKFTHKFSQPVEVRFNVTNGGTIADIVDNSWHVMANSISTTYGYNLYYNCRVCYKE